MTSRRVALTSLVVAVSPLGCGAPPPVVVPAPPLLALTRDRYVLPPEPPAPKPTWVDDDARRALEAEWPPVDALTRPEPPPPEGPRRVRPAPRFGPPRRPLPPPPSPRGPGVHGVIEARPVILRAAPSPGAPARVVFVLESR